MKKNKKALATFEGFSYSHRKEYVEWVTDANTHETRDRRLQTTVEWLEQERRATGNMSAAESKRAGSGKAHCRPDL